MNFMISINELNKYHEKFLKIKLLNYRTASKAHLAVKNEIENRHKSSKIIRKHGGLKNKNRYFHLKGHRATPYYHSCRAISWLFSILLRQKKNIIPFFLLGNVFVDLMAFWPRELVCCLQNWHGIKIPRIFIVIRKKVELLRKKNRFHYFLLVITLTKKFVKPWRVQNIVVKH